MKNKVRTAVIGIGNMGKNHARIYSQISNLVAIADLNESIGIPMANRFKTKYYKNYKKMLQEEKPEAVSVVVPTPYHKEVAINCLNKKIPVLVEKPIASSIKDARSILNVAKKQKTLVMIGHLERFNPSVIKLKKLIEADKIGNIISILAMRVGISPPKIKNANVILELGIHDVDIINYLLDELPKEKTIIKNKLFKNNLVDFSTILLKYKKATAVIKTNWITPIKMRKLYVTGINGFAEIDYITQKLTIYNKILHTEKIGSFLDLISISKGSKKEIFISKKEPLKEELKYFLINFKKLDYTNAINSIKALEVLT